MNRADLEGSACLDERSRYFAKILHVGAKKDRNPNCRGFNRIVPALGDKTPSDKDHLSKTITACQFTKGIEDQQRASSVAAAAAKAHGEPVLLGQSRYLWCPFDIAWGKQQLKVGAIMQKLCIGLQQQGFLALVG